MTDKALDQNDDLTPMQEYFTAGTVILLFGLLYWLLNHDWNTETTALLSKNANPPLVERATIDDTKATRLSSSADSPGKPARTPETAPGIATSIPAPTEAGSTSQANAAPPPEEDTHQIAAMQAKIDKLKTENSALKQAEAERLKAAQQAAVAMPSDTTPTNEQPASESDTYTLPDGTAVTLAPTGLEQDFKQAISRKETNKPLAFDNIYFDTGAIELNPASEQQIKAIAALLHKAPAIKIMLRGHTDNIGLPAANAQLSLLRANSVGLALVNLGIDRQRIRIMGMGDTLPIDSNTTEAGRKNNRRIDISIIEQ